MSSRLSALARLLLPAVLALASGCSTVCDREKLPHAGDSSTPEHLVDLMLYACRNHCWRVLYDHASEKTRAEYSYIKFRIGFPSLKQPGSDDKVVDLVASSTPDVISHSHLGDQYRLAYLDHRVGAEEKDLNVLLVLEQGEDEKPEWHVALQEQIERKVPFE